MVSNLIPHSDRPRPTPKIVPNLRTSYVTEGVPDLVFLYLN